MAQYYSEYSIFLKTKDKDIKEKIAPTTGIKINLEENDRDADNLEFERQQVEQRDKTQIGYEQLRSINPINPTEICLFQNMCLVL